MSPDDRRLADDRRRARARVTGVLLGLFVVLVFALAIAKIRAGMG